MPRKKAVKSSARRQTTTSPMAAIKKMEQEFLASPSKMTSQLNKEIANWKQKESKLKKAASKLKAQVKQAEKRIKLAEKAKATTATSRKQLLNAKKMHQDYVKSQTALTKQQQDIAKTLETLATRQSKLSALRKHLSQFEKDWKANSKTETAARTKTAVVSKKKNKKAAPAKPSLNTTTPAIDHAKTEPTQRMHDDISVDEKETETTN